MAIHSVGEPFEIVNRIIRDKKSSNLILRLEDMLLSENADVFQVVEAIIKLFTHFISSEDMFCSSNEKGQNSLTQYKQWLQDRYNDFKNHLLDYFLHSDQDIQKCALDGYMKLVHVEGLHSRMKLSLDAWYFPKESFEAVIKQLVNEGTAMTPLIVHFKAYLKNDTKLYALKVLYDILQNSVQQSEVFFFNAFCLLTKLLFPKDLTDDVAISHSVFISAESSPKFELKKKTFTKAFTQTWLQFLKCKIPTALYKKLLTILPKIVLPHLNDPLLLTDFLTISYNSGGIVSLLALNSIFYLMQNYNLEYPDFYMKLYSLFVVEVVISQYRSTFFYLADLFLSSTHLPAYLVAAFLKRLSRLALFVPPDVGIVILTFAKNLLIRHPSLLTLIHNQEQKSINKDSYCFEDCNPATSNALKSSLWEIMTLENHWHPKVSSMAEDFRSDLPQTEQSISEVTDLTIHEMRKEAWITFSEVQLSCVKPSSFFHRTEDHMNDFWTL